MNTSWWRKSSELDSDQLEFLKFKPEGRYLLDGPPGSGKTNLLLLRAKFLHLKNFKNVLVITYTNTLSDFIKSGIIESKDLPVDQIKTFHSWALSYIRTNGGHIELKQDGFTEETRAQILVELKRINDKVLKQTASIYSAILVDEAQDFTQEELFELLRLSPNFCICGDNRQGIFKKDGLSVASQFPGVIQKTLKTHYRIGPRIAEVAERQCPSPEGQRSLIDTSNYNKTISGESTAELHVCADRDEQFALMMKWLLLHMDAFPDEALGVLCVNQKTRNELRDRFHASNLKNLTCFHGMETGASFSSQDVRIHIMTIYSAKGAEFRSVHIFGAEDFAVGPAQRTSLGYTAITRAKTALHAYVTGKTAPAFLAAFSAPRHVEVDALFPEKG